MFAFLNEFLVKEAEIEQQQPVRCLLNPAKLSALCINLLDNMNKVLEKHYSVTEEWDYVESSESEEPSEERIDYSKTNEKTFQLKLEKNFLKSLFEQFADPFETFDENGKWF